VKNEWKHMTRNCVFKKDCSRALFIVFFGITPKKFLYKVQMIYCFIISSLPSLAFYWNQEQLRAIFNIFLLDTILKKSSSVWSLKNYEKVQVSKLKLKPFEMLDVWVIDLYKINILYWYNSNGRFNWPINTIYFTKKRKKKRSR
jgi:hypothetical protein